MRTAIVYVFPSVALPVYVPLARQFVNSYLEHPPGREDHELHVVVNGPPLEERQLRIFEPLGAVFHAHNNYGRDIGAFMMAALKLSADLMVCLGAPVHFHRPGWLDRILEAYYQCGPGLYGCRGFHQPQPHIRTTAFWLPPALLASYPHPVDDSHRYEFELGARNSILQWTLACGLPAGIVTWRAAWMYPRFEHVTKADGLLLDQHTDRHSE